jgi:hypothetical protein
MQIKFNPMKKTIILTLFLALAFTAQAQQDYRPWKDFDGDTLRYLKANFEENSSRYVGQPFERVINAYELPLRDVNLGGEAYSVKHVQLFYMAQHEALAAFLKGRELHLLLVYFEEPFVSTHHSPLQKQLPNGQWDQDRDPMAIAMKMKNCIVSKIEILTEHKDFEDNQ